jgi:hypothetical protein
MYNTFAMSSLMGVGWTFGLLAIINPSPVLQWLFSIAVGLQVQLVVDAKQVPFLQLMVTFTGHLYLLHPSVSEAVCTREMLEP